MVGFQGGDMMIGQDAAAPRTLEQILAGRMGGEFGLD